MDITEAGITKEIARLGGVREQLLANLNYTNGRIEGLQALLEKPVAAPEGNEGAVPGSQKGPKRVQRVAAG